MLGALRRMKSEEIKNRLNKRRRPPMMGTAPFSYLRMADSVSRRSSRCEQIPSYDRGVGKPQFCASLQKLSRALVAEAETALPVSATCDPTDGLTATVSVSVAG